jgi:riboflavin synthase
MFTGIVEEMGAVLEAGSSLRVRVRTVGSDSGVGASLAVNGVCLTVVDRRPDGQPDGRSEASADGPEVADVILSFDLSDETLARTSLGRSRPGDRVNLERPVMAEGRLGGHLVQGHVDGVGTIREVRQVRTGRELSVGLPGPLGRYVAEKGSITVDGVSLTVTQVVGDAFGVALIPFTLEATTLGEREPGDAVNLEVDVVARYVERLLTASRGVGMTGVEPHPARWMDAVGEDRIGS